MAFQRCVSTLEQACIDQDIETVKSELLKDLNGTQRFQPQRFGEGCLGGEEEHSIYLHCILNNNLEILRLVTDVYTPRVERLGNSIFHILQLGHMDMLEWAVGHVKRLIDHDPSDFSKRMLNCEVYAKCLLELEPKNTSPLAMLRGIKLLLPLLDHNSVVQTTALALDTQHIDVARELMEHCTTEDIHRLNTKDADSIMVDLVANVLEERARIVFKNKLLNELPQPLRTTRTSKI